MSAVVGLVILTFDLLTLKQVHESPGSWASILPNMDFRGLSVLNLGRGTGRTDRQTDEGHQRLMPLPTEVRVIISNRRIGTQVVSTAEVTFKRHSRSPAISPFDTFLITFLISIPLQLCPYLVQHCVLPF